MRLAELLKSLLNAGTYLNAFFDLHFYCRIKRLPSMKKIKLYVNWKYSGDFLRVALLYNYIKIKNSAEELQNHKV